MSAPKLPLVMVEWVDANGSAAQDTWQDVTETTNELSACRSVGWLAKKDKKAMTLFSALGVHPESDVTYGHSQQTIPMANVTKVTKLK